jgi:hypothetical protein
LFALLAALSPSRHFAALIASAASWLRRFQFASFAAAPRLSAAADVSC